MASGKQAMTYNATFSIPNWRDTWEFDWDFARAKGRRRLPDGRRL